MDVWRKEWFVAVLCLMILAATGLRLAHVAADAGATRDAQIATYGTADPADAGAGPGAR
ncbi:MAG: hypothetical protein WCF36_19510 [Candidatus Nanopelagicales bacterium]